MHSLAIAGGILHSVNAESKGKGKPILLSKPETMHTHISTKETAALLLLSSTSTQRSVP